MKNRLLLRITGIRCVVMQGYRRFGLLFAVNAGLVSAGQGDSFHRIDAPPGTTELRFNLAISDGSMNSSPGYLVQRSSQPLEELRALPPAIAEEYSGKDYSAYEIAVLPDQTRYLAVLHDEKRLKPMNRQDYNQWWYARLYRLAGDDDSSAELLREGIQSLGNDVTFPVELPIAGMGRSKVDKFRTEAGYSISSVQSGRPQVFNGRGSPLTVSGSVLREEGKLTLSFAIPDALSVTTDVQATLQFQPLQPGLPERSATGKLTDFLNLGSARFMVTEVSSDFSVATVCVVGGTLEQSAKQQLQLGTKLPPFSQVDLITRKTVTREHILSRAQDTAGVIFIFGDLQTPVSGYGPHMGPYGPMAEGALPLRLAEVIEQSAVEMQPGPLVVIVTRHIGLDLLYQDLRNQEPEYLILADFTDPLRTTFRLPQTPGGWYGHSPQAGEEASLRQLFNLPAGMVSVVAFDRNGSVVHANSKAGGMAFLTSLAEARSALRETAK